MRLISIPFLSPLAIFSFAWEIKASTFFRVIASLKLRWQMVRDEHEIIGFLERTIPIYPIALPWIDILNDDRSSPRTLKYISCIPSVSLNIVLLFTHRFSWVSIWVFNPIIVVAADDPPPPLREVVVGTGSFFFVPNQFIVYFSISLFCWWWKLIYFYIHTHGTRWSFLVVLTCFLAYNTAHHRCLCCGIVRVLFLQEGYAVRFSLFRGTLV